MNKYFFINKLLNFTQYRAMPLVEQKVKRIRQNTFFDIGKETLGNKSPRALVINISTAIPYYIEGNLHKCPILDGHALYWEVAELVRQLNEIGYIVDFIDCYEENPTIQWDKYDVVFDERNNLISAPTINGQKKVFFATGLKWDFHNQAELTRLEWFERRTGISLNPERFLKPIFSDRFADWIVYYGNDKWMDLYDVKPIRHSLRISCPILGERPKINREREFIWMGSVGAVHKGLDIVVELFKKHPDWKLNVFGNVQKDVKFSSWFNKELENSTNIIYHGYADVNSLAFRKIIRKCIAHVYPSASENGAGSVIQTGHFGLIPILTDTANTRIEHLGYVVDKRYELDIFDQLELSIKNVLSLSAKELEIQMENIFEYCRKFHTREAFRNNIQELLIKMEL